jgi:hypothetical protein
MLKTNQIKADIPMLTKEERMELNQLSKELFGGLPFVFFTSDLPTDKVARYNFLIKKKIDCMKALMN